MPGFRFSQNGSTYSCSSVVIKCTAPFNQVQAKIEENRFVYTCTRIN